MSIKCGRSIFFRPHASLSNWNECRFLPIARTFPPWKSPKQLRGMFKSSASFTFWLRKLVITVNFLPFLRPVREKSQFYFVSLTSFLSSRLCFDCLCFRCPQPRSTGYEDERLMSIDQRSLKGKFSNMVAVAKLSVNGCAEIESLLAFCRIPTEIICVEEEKEFESKQVWNCWFFEKGKQKMPFCSVKISSQWKIDESIVSYLFWEIAFIAMHKLHLQFLNFP